MTKKVNKKVKSKYAGLPGWRKLDRTSISTRRVLLNPAGLDAEKGFKQIIIPSQPIQCFPTPKN